MKASCCVLLVALLTLPAAVRGQCVGGYCAAPQSFSLPTSFSLPQSYSYERSGLFGRVQVRQSFSLPQTYALPTSYALPQTFSVPQATSCYSSRVLLNYLPVETSQVQLFPIETRL